MKPILGVLMIAMAVAGCRGCGVRLQQSAPAELSLAPRRLEFPPTFIDQRSRLTLQASNSGKQTTFVELSTTAPFSSSTVSLTIEGASSEQIEVEFAPIAPGLFTGTMSAGDLVVEVQGEGLPVPQCSTPNPCEASAFNPSTSQCLLTQLPDGTSCAEVCLTDGQCASGTCVGRARDCSDSDACTVDGCGVEGCVRAPVVCPSPGGPCQASACDSVTGCGAVDVPDGTLCGPDLCASSNVDVCIVGQCVTRPRPDNARCTNTWLPASLPGRTQHAIVYDAARGRVVLFGGRDGTPVFADTWEWDGLSWTQRIPAASPPARTGHALAYDAGRRRVVLFGGTDSSGSVVFDDTWEWDGVTWVARAAGPSPAGRWDHALAYDIARGRVVLFGGGGPQGKLGDTWEWSGSAWVQRTPTSPPSARSKHALAYDDLRQRLVLFGGFDTNQLGDTWEWDGANWTQRTSTTTPPSRGGHALAYDAARKRVVLVGGYQLGAPNDFWDAWEWDGVAWVQRSAPPEDIESSLAYDGARHRVVFVGSYQTWEWDGAIWRQPNAKPSGRSLPALTYDAAHARVLLFGGFEHGSGVRADTWEWNGTNWLERLPPISPPARYGAGMAYDEVRQRVVVFGGSVGGVDFNDTWEWDGSTWIGRTPAGSPPAGVAAKRLLYDSAAQRVLLLGDPVWEWDGSNWSQRAVTGAPSSRSFTAVTYDEARQRSLLFGGANPNTGISLADTWEFAGNTWTQRLPATSPPTLQRHGMAYDASRQKVLLFGGGLDTWTWEWDGSDWSQRFPTVSPISGSESTLIYDAARQKVINYDGDNIWVFLP